MKGTYRVVVQNKKIKYDFEIKRNLTVIQGDSATGKTTLVEMIQEYYENGDDSGISVVADRTCAVIEGRGWKGQLSELSKCIIFIDEGNRFVSSREFAEVIRETDNYYVIVTRESLETLPYSVSEIYGIRTSGKYGSLKQTYNEMFHIYEKDNYAEEIRPDLVIAEDSNAGFQFFDSVCEHNNIQCISANGKSNVFQMVNKCNSKNMLIVADGAAFGSEMRRLMQLIKKSEDIVLYLPESFEWLVLRSGIFEERRVKGILEDPGSYIESSEFFSWERFFTSLLINLTKDSYLKYSKRVLNKAYTERNISDKILNGMTGIDLLWKREKGESADAVSESTDRPGG